MENIGKTDKILYEGDFIDLNKPYVIKNIMTGACIQCCEF